MKRKFDIPAANLREPESIPEFWVSTVEGVGTFLRSRVKKGALRTIGKTAGGRTIQAVFYGRPREGRGTTTYSGSLGFGNVAAYRGPDHARKVYWAMAGVHGGEFEGMIGMVNLLSVIETGADLRGTAWPEIETAARALDRLILIPIVNVDGRARIPLRMIRHQGTDETVHEYFNTGAKPDGSNIGWPQCKEHIPLDFAKTQFPGGYPNDAGVNIQHDDFFGARQPETQALCDLAARERPDLLLNLHTGANYLHPLRSFVEPTLIPVFEDLYRQLMTKLTERGHQMSGDAAREADPKRERPPVYNLDTALNLHCGGLPLLIESPSHNFSHAKRNGQPVFHTPGDLLEAQLLCHQEAMKFLAATGGRAEWTRRRAGA
jgi:predicted deacylase